MNPLTESEQRRRKAALTIVKTLSEETSIIAKPLSKVDIKNIPNNAEAGIRKYIRTLKNHEVYGSASMATHSIHARRPNDLDIVVGNPRKVAYAFSNIMRRKGIKTKVVGNHEWGSYIVQANIKGEWVDSCDVHPISEFRGKYDFYGSSQQPLNKSGITLQRASDQLLRKFNAVTERQKDGSMGSTPHREIKDTTDAIQITELLLASMQLKSKAQLAKAKQVKEELKVWKAHLRKLKGGKKKVTSKRKPLSVTRQGKFVRKAVTQPGKDIDDLIFENGKVIERKVPLIKKVSEAPKMVAIDPYYGVAQSPYLQNSKKKRRRQKSKRKASVPYGKTIKTTHSFSKNIKNVGKTRRGRK
jgi:hypothetical protein